MRKPAKVSDPASKERNQKWPEIYTADGHPIELNQLLYSGTYHEDNWSKKVSAQVNVYRVTRIDLRYRTVRMRCAKGCETFLQLNQGCSIEKYYAQKPLVLAVIKNKMAKSIKELTESINRKKEKISDIKKINIVVSPVPPEEQSK